MRKILVTGGAGFIGSNFIEEISRVYPEYQIVNLDKLTYAGNLKNLSFISSSPNYKFIEGDICDNALVEKVFREYEISDVVHFAAESHVDNSIDDPECFIRTNVFGTFTLLDAAKNFWMEKPFELKDRFKMSRFLHVSTDEVYGALGNSGKFQESSCYAPNSPYSASKASSDMLVRSYSKTYGLPTNITNCSNNYGPKQDKEKLIPKVILKAISKEEIPVYGEGKNIRDWLHVKDHCSALLTILHNGAIGEKYNIGGETELRNIDLVRTICDTLDEVRPLHKGRYSQYITFVDDRAGHDFRYAVEIEKICSSLGWKPSVPFRRGLEDTVRWYLNEF